MVIRGIRNYDKFTLKESFYETADAKLVHLDILQGEFHPEGYIHIKVNTSELNFFVGDYLVLFIPKREVKIRSALDLLESKKENPLFDEDWVCEEIRKLERDLEDEFSSVSEDEVWIMNCYMVMYTLGEGGSKQLHTVLSGVPSKVRHMFSDERTYVLDEGDVVVAPDGIPQGVYHYEKAGEKHYTKDASMGLHVGE